MTSLVKHYALTDKSKVLRLECLEVLVFRISLLFVTVSSVCLNPPPPCVALLPPQTPGLAATRAAVYLCRLSSAQLFLEIEAAAASETPFLLACVDPICWCFSMLFVSGKRRCRTFPAGESWRLTHCTRGSSASRVPTHSTLQRCAWARASTCGKQRCEGGGGAT